jgi:hypothetical protein
METTHFDDKCMIECTNNDRKVEAEVMAFKEHDFLSVSIQRSIKINMRYNERKGVYIGNQSGLEFITEGPQKFVSKHTR